MFDYSTRRDKRKAFSRLIHKKFNIMLFLLTFMCDTGKIGVQLIIKWGAFNEAYGKKNT